LITSLISPLHSVVITLRTIKLLRNSPNYLLQLLTLGKWVMVH